MKKGILLILVLVAGFYSGAIAQNAKPAAENRTKVLIKTEFGDIRMVLYNETPKHRDNFIKLINQGWYNGSPFHRVIKNFMVQGGQNADGRQDPNYKVDAEFVPKFYHKRGALAAARQGDDVNPAKASSGSQFYIVHGNKFDDATLDAMEKRFSRTWTAEQRQVYKTQGGAPHLDGGYTVFGEVISGMEVVDKIAEQACDQANKPLKDIKMTVSVIK